MFGNPVEGPRIVPFAEARTAKDYLPNGHPGFRVTQRFGDWDAFFRDRTHGAMDIGNFYCSDRVLAMAAGRMVHLRDPNGALGVQVQHTGGYATEYWHLRVRIGDHGSYVDRGELIGQVGSTGLNIAGCHLHVVVRAPSGLPIDPWPLLDQNVSQAKYVTVSAGARLRKSPTATAPLIKELVVAMRLQRAGAIAKGGTYLYLLNGKWVQGDKWIPVSYLGVQVWVILPFAKAA